MPRRGWNEPWRVNSAVPSEIQKERRDRGAAGGQAGSAGQGLPLSNPCRSPAAGKMKLPGCRANETFLVPVRAANKPAVRVNTPCGFRPPGVRQFQHLRAGGRVKGRRGPLDNPRGRQPLLYLRLSLRPDGPPGLASPWRVPASRRRPVGSSWPALFPQRAGCLHQPPPVILLFIKTDSCCLRF